MGVLNKKYSWFTVPDNEPYHFDFDKAIIRVLIGIVLLGMIVAIASCSMNKKIAKAYEFAANTNPVTAKDSLNGIKIGKKLLPKEKPKIIPGKTIRVPYPVNKIKKVIDTIELERLTDSIFIAHSEEINNTVDECIANEKAALQRGIKEGYKKRNNELSKDSFETKTPDTVFIPDNEASLDLSDCEIKLRQAQASLIASEAVKNTYKWLFWLLLGGVIVGGVFGIKKLLTPKNILK